MSVAKVILLSSNPYKRQLIKEHRLKKDSTGLLKNIAAIELGCDRYLDLVQVDP